MVPWYWILFVGILLVIFFYLQDSLTTPFWCWPRTSAPCPEWDMAAGLGMQPLDHNILNLVSLAFTLIFPIITFSLLSHTILTTMKRHSSVSHLEHNEKERCFICFPPRQSGPSTLHYGRIHLLLLRSCGTSFLPARSGRRVHSCLEACLSASISC